MAITLAGVPNEELVGRLKQFVAKEKELTHRIVLHLAELDRRRLYARLGYSSLFDYCTRGLGYAPSSAQRRIKAARAVEAIPEVYECLENGTLSLGVIEVVADALTGPNGRELVKEICGKTKGEARRVIAAYQPLGPEMLRDRIEPIVIRRISESKRSYFRAEVGSDLGAEAGMEARTETACELEPGVRVTFSAGEMLMEMLDHARTLVFGSFGPKELEPLLERIVDDYIERHCPRARARRRQEKEERKGNRLLGAVETVREASEAIAGSMSPSELDPRRSRYVSDALREQVYERDGHVCSYVSKDGTKCECYTELQVDHIMPFAYGGLTELANLRTVCRTHNHLLARESYGDAYIESIIERRRVGKDGRPTVAPTPGEFINKADELLFG